MCNFTAKQTQIATQIFELPCTLVHIFGGFLSSYHVVKQICLHVIQELFLASAGAEALHILRI